MSERKLKLERRTAIKSWTPIKTVDKPTMTRNAPEKVDIPHPKPSQYGRPQNPDSFFCRPCFRGVVENNKYGALHVGDAASL